MNCLILVLLLLCCGNNGNCCDNDFEGRRGECSERRRCDNENDGCGCRNERSDNNDCGCRNEFRPEPRFEQRPFMFNQGGGCGCEEQQNNCDR